MNKRTLALAVVAVFVVSALGAVFLIVDGDDDEVVAGAKDTTSTTTVELTATAQELVDRLASARERPLHLTFKGRLAAAPQAGELIIDIWWKGDLARQDIRADGSAALQQQQSSFAIPSGNVTCVKVQTAEWSCQKAESAASAVGKPGGIIESLVSQLNGRDITRAKAQVGDTEVDCYTIDKATGGVVCLRSDDVPAKFTVAGSELLLTSVVDDVDDADFTPPAEPTEAPRTATTPTTAG